MRQLDLFSATTTTGPLDPAAPAHPWETLDWPHGLTYTVGHTAHLLDSRAKRVQWLVQAGGSAGITHDELHAQLTEREPKWPENMAHAFIYRAWTAGRFERVYHRAEQEHRYHPIADPDDGRRRHKPERRI